MGPTTSPNDFQSIRQLIGNDKLKKACTLLASTFPTNEITTLKGRLASLEVRNSKGILASGDYELARNRIRDNLLNLVDRCESGEVVSTKKRRRRLYWLVGIISLLGIALAWMFWPSNNAKSIFPPNDTANFNVLILRFNDFPPGEDTDCIGRSMQEYLNVIQANEQPVLPLQVNYTDSITSPNDLKKAKDIQKRHHADLIIYGLATVQEGCTEAEICFRYNIADQIIAHAAHITEFKPFKHDSDRISIDLRNLGKSMPQIDSLSLTHWIISLINIKINIIKEAFLELDKIAADTALNDEQRVQRLLILGKKHPILRKDVQALKKSDQAMVLNPKRALTYHNRGMAYRDLRQYERAIQDYNKAIELNPKDDVVYNNKGLAHNDLKQYERAIKAYDRSIELDSNDYVPYSNRGDAYSELRQYERAIQDYDKAIELNPHNATTYHNRGLSYANLKKYERAIQDYDQVIELNPKSTSGYNSRGSAYANLEYYSLAIKDYDKVIELRPTYAYGYNNRGNVFRRIGNLEKAKVDVQKSLSLDDENGWAYATLAMIFADEGKADLFYKNCEMAISKPLAYPLKEKLEKEETLQRFRNDPKFLELLERSAK